MTSSVLINPATEEELRKVEQTSVEGTDDAIARAKVAQREWARQAPADRAAALRAFAAVVDAHVDELAALEVANSGHPIGNASWEAGHVYEWWNGAGAWAGPVLSAEVHFDGPHGRVSLPAAQLAVVAARAQDLRDADGLFGLAYSGLDTAHDFGGNLFARKHPHPACRQLDR